MRGRDTVGASFLAYFGLGLILLSACFPWMTMKFGSSGRSIGPFATSQMRPSSIILLAAMLGLAVYHALRGSGLKYLVLPTQMWGCFAAFFWISGISIQNLLPRVIVPEGVIPIANFSLFFGMLGAFLVSLVAIMSVTMDLDSIRIPLVQIVISFACVVLLLTCRDVPWIRLEVGPSEWSFGADSIPFLGGLLGFLGVLTSISVLVTLLWGHRWSAILTVLAGGLFIPIGMFSLAASSLLRRGAKAGLSGLGVDISSIEQVKFSHGPWLVIVAGIFAALLGVFELTSSSRSTQPVRFEPVTQENQPQRFF